MARTIGLAVVLQKEVKIMSKSKRCHCNHELSSASVEGCGCSNSQEAKKSATNNQWTTASRGSCACACDEGHK